MLVASHTQLSWVLKVPLARQRTLALLSTRWPDIDVSVDGNTWAGSNHIDSFYMPVPFSCDSDNETCHYEYLRQRCSAVDAWLLLPALNHEPSLVSPISLNRRSNCRFQCQFSWRVDGLRCWTKNDDLLGQLHRSQLEEYTPYLIRLEWVSMVTPKM